MDGPLRGFLLHDNGTGIRNVCRRFVTLCRELTPFSQAIVAIDSSQFKAVNSRDCDFSPGKIDRRQEQVEHSIARCLDTLETADRTQPAEVEAKAVRLQDMIMRLHEQMRQLEQPREWLKGEPHGQLSTTDPDACSMISQAEGSGLVGYNVQAAVDGKYHLIMTHEVINLGNDRAQLNQVAQLAPEAIGRKRRQASREDYKDVMQMSVICWVSTLILAPSMRSSSNDRATRLSER